MKAKLSLLILALSVYSNAFSQRILKEYWDYAKTQIKEELQVNAMGLGHGYYRSYYRRGGYKETGFFTNGKKTGLWSQYSEGATKPWYQSKMIYAQDEEGFWHQYKTMEKYWFGSGPSSGKLKEWTEWDVSELGENGDYLITKHVLYTEDEVNENYNIVRYGVGYHMLYDLDIRGTLPVEKRYFKEYYSTGKIRHQWIFNKKGERIESWYDKNGGLTKQETFINNEITEVVSKNNNSKTEYNKNSFIVDVATYIFKEPDLNSNTLMELEKGTILVATSSNSKDFRKVIYKGITGYVYILSLSPVAK